MQPGDLVPDFTATFDDGSSATLTRILTWGPVVLFFYPKAFSGGCTAEACHFRDLGAEFAAVGAQRFGVSRDDVETQTAFRSEHGLDYPLIADEDGSIARIFGAKRVGPLWSKRLTAVIGTDRRLLHVTKSESDMEVHADEALDVLRRREAA